MRALHAMEKYPSRGGEAKTDVIRHLSSFFQKIKIIIWQVLRKRSVYKNDG